MSINTHTPPMLTDDEIIEVFSKTPVSKTPWGYEIQCVRALLSKLRAPVADERAAFEVWAVKTHGKFTLSDPDAGAMWSAWQARAALASAPVAGEAHKPLGWIVRERRSPEGKLRDCFVEAPAENGCAYGLEVLGDDYTGYGDVERKRQHCQMIVDWANAAPQASEASVNYAHNAAIKAAATICTDIAGRYDQENALAGELYGASLAILKLLKKD